MRLCKTSFVYQHKCLTAAQSKILLERLKPFTRGYADANLSKILGCSRRTAHRLNAALRNGKSVRIRKTYLDNACAFTGLSKAQLLLTGSMNSVVQAGMQELLAKDTLPKMEQNKIMMRLAADMALKCMFDYDMPASVTVDSDGNLNVMEARIQCRKDDDLASIHTITLMRDNLAGWQITYAPPQQPVRYRGAVTEENYTSILDFINE